MQKIVNVIKRNLLNLKGFSWLLFNIKPIVIIQPNIKTTPKIPNTAFKICINGDSIIQIYVR